MMFGGKKRSDPIRRLEADIAHFGERRGALEARQQALEAELKAARDDRRRVLVDGALDSDAISAIESRVMAIEAALSGIADALGEMDQRTQAAQAELDQLQAKAAREIAAAALSEDIASAERALEQFTGATGQLAAALEKLEQADIIAVRHYLQQAIEAVPAATIIGFDGLRRIIADETQPIPSRQQARPQPAAPRPPTRRIFPLKNLKYRDHNGNVVTTAQHWDFDAPIDVADRALARGLAIASDSDQARRLRFQRGAFGAAAVDCHDLDDETAPEPKPVARLPADMIQPFDRGAGGTARVMVDRS